MAEISPGFSGFRITNYWKYILYLAGVILILSLFLDAPGIDNDKLRNISFWIVVGGLFIWFIKEIINRIFDHLEFLHRYNKIYDGDLEFYSNLLLVADYVIQIIIWSILFFTLLAMI